MAAAVRKWERPGFTLDISSWLPVFMSRFRPVILGSSGAAWTLLKHPLSHSARESPWVVNSAFGGRQSAAKRTAPCPGLCYMGIYYRSATGSQAVDSK